MATSMRSAAPTSVARCSALAATWKLDAVEVALRAALVREARPQVGDLRILNLTERARVADEERHGAALALGPPALDLHASAQAAHVRPDVVDVLPIGVLDLELRHEWAHVAEVLGLSEELSRPVPGAQVGQVAAARAPQGAVICNHHDDVLSARGALLVCHHAPQRGGGVFVRRAIDGAVGGRARPGRAAGPAAAAVARVLLHPHLRILVRHVPSILGVGMQRPVDVRLAAKAATALIRELLHHDALTL
eukprot:CAMPEP_0198222054 /NCGR_PEP_ID=MMETSP1445-20131203/86388_1 /TAXON_ID=36898 /ORGANISM="Pyramimonas sp., Strain CCMP2087" /LENGTH=249 /DNA_ID=CAMNT_0043900413 /DNA_START=211 /DNA_END=959 /DNA_ORIENTATION=+